MKKGFTLIELLIVIAILGTLAVVVLLALNPVQQLARTRDAGRIQGVAQLGHAIEASATVNNGTYPTATTTWITDLQGAGEISTIPSTVNYTAGGTGGRTAATACDTNMQANYCYSSALNPPRAIVFSRLESGSQNSRCTGGTLYAWAVYSTADGRGGIICTAGDATNPTVPGATGYGAALLQ